MMRECSEIIKMSNDYVLGIDQGKEDRTVWVVIERDTRKEITK